MRRQETKVSVLIIQSSRIGFLMKVPVIIYGRLIQIYPNGQCATSTSTYSMYDLEMRIGMFDTGLKRE